MPWNGNNNWMPWNGNNNGNNWNSNPNMNWNSNNWAPSGNGFVPNNAQGNGAPQQAPAPAQR
jgi:hypothetical protein